MYCSTALSDYRTSEHLKKKFPGRLMNLMLEDFIKTPVSKLEELQDFLGFRLGPDILHKI